VDLTIKKQSHVSEFKNELVKIIIIIDGVSVIEGAGQLEFQRAFCMLGALSI